MFTQLVQSLSRLLPHAAPSAARPDEREPREHGWHESSWVLAHGVDVIELPPMVAASLFPDTQPAFHDPSEESPLAA